MSSIQFYGGSAPGLEAGTYTITVTQTLGTPASYPPQQPPPSSMPSYTAWQQFTVNGYEFTIPSTLIVSQYPPDGGSDAYDQTLPFIVFSDNFLPWVRTIVPGASPADPPQPWIALLLFASTELDFPSGSTTPLDTVTVTQLLTPQDGVVIPNIDLSALSSDVQNSTCTTISISGASFNSILPASNDLHTSLTSGP